jgi:hypothetical protein
MSKHSQYHGVDHLLMLCVGIVLASHCDDKLTIVGLVVDHKQSTLLNNILHSVFLPARTCRVSF